jgi:hypothetical protein
MLSCSRAELGNKEAGAGGRAGRCTDGQLRHVSVVAQGRQAHVRANVSMRAKVAAAQHRDVNAGDALCKPAFCALRDGHMRLR